MQAHPGRDCDCPAGQGLHSVCPVSLLKLPGAQSSHTEAPGSDMRLPTGHNSQYDFPATENVQV